MNKIKNRLFLRQVFLGICSFGKADNRILMATEDRMIFLNNDGTETILNFEN